MNSISSTNCSAFAIPAPGKPNSAETLIPGVFRSRVEAHAQKGDTCFFKAFKMMQDNQVIGKNPSEDQMKLYKMERLFSDYRKQCTKNDYLFWSIQSLLPEIALRERKALLSNGPFNLCNREQASLMLARVDELFRKDECEIARTVLTAFCDQDLHNCYQDFITDENLKRQISIHFALLEKMGITEVELIKLRTTYLEKRKGLEEWINGNPMGNFNREQIKSLLERLTNLSTADAFPILESFCEQKDIDNFSEHFKNTSELILWDLIEDKFNEFQVTVDHFIISDFRSFTNYELTNKRFNSYIKLLIERLQIQTFGAFSSPWHPSDPITVLIEQIQLHGPHLMGGLVGKEYYVITRPPVSQFKVEGRKVYYWPLGATRKENPNLSHVVVVVGAKRENDKDYIYFLDPKDGSMPNDLDSQNLYLMSYAKFISYLYPIGTEFQGSKDVRWKSAGANNFAVHM